MIFIFIFIFLHTNFMSVNTPIMANVQLPVWTPWTHSQKCRCTISFCEAVLASSSMGGPPVSQELPTVQDLRVRDPSDECACRTQEKGWGYLAKPELSFPLLLVSSSVPSALAGYKIAVQESVRRRVGKRARANHSPFLKGRQLPTIGLSPGKMRRYLISEWRRWRHWLIPWTAFNLVTELGLRVGS